jgi:AcrR family transcriptional regulator
MPRSRTRLDPEIRREQIVDAAARVLEDRDPAAVTFEEIADEAGVSRALVYNYFGDRGGVLAAVYLRALHRLDAELAEAFKPDLPPGEQVREIVRCYLRFAHGNSSAWRVLHMAGTMTHPSVQGARRKRMLKLAETWGGGPEARVVAFGVVGMLEAATVDWLCTRDVEPDRMADVLTTLLWTGLSSFTP